MAKGYLDPDEGSCLTAMFFFVIFGAAMGALIAILMQAVTR